MFLQLGAVALGAVSVVLTVLAVRARRRERVLAAAGAGLVVTLAAVLLAGRWLGADVLLAALAAAVIETVRMMVGRLRAAAAAPSGHDDAAGLDPDDDGEQ